MADRMRARRRKLKMSQQDLADKLSTLSDEAVARSTVASWEVFRSYPSRDKTKIIAKALNCSHMWLTDGKGDEEQDDYTWEAVEMADPEDFIEEAMLRESVGALYQSGANPDLPKLRRAKNKTKHIFAYPVVNDVNANPAGFPTIPAGYVAICDRGMRWKDGSIVLMQRGSEVPAIYKLVITAGEEYFKPLNPTYATLRYNAETDVIIAVVIRAEATF